ncbi:MAG TPA: bifunctional phosphoribosyl-AMP cyclohydrolase/phosphoribosyl-ATP diphosphatase HisIE [Chitinophagales bacterium]|nr:bifunctional phosphoribosyl-AMP cyclohydrolase/phosphoribosyl-ATP diphosphatase HisIE [Chitinophagales bacterium]
MQVDFTKGLIPAIIQHHLTNRVLMLGFMNEEALQKTKAEGKVTFFSRGKNRLWTKGETSGNFLFVKEIIPDCDNDTLLIKAEPAGPVCHKGSLACFDETNAKGFLYQLEKVIHDRRQNPKEGSYTARLFSEGISKIAQKVGEEAVELVIEAKDNSREKFLNEAADLMYHLLVLIAAKGCTMNEVEMQLQHRS